jgi:two-component system, NtrC family, response regulator AtoC
MAHLLVIEDEQILAKNVARYFERQGHVVTLAHDGQRGLSMAQENPPDVAIVDFQLPSLNGIEVIRELRRLDEELRIVMITGHGSIDVAVEAMKAGSMDLLTKPLSLGSLENVVQRALQERAGRTMLRYYRDREQQHASIHALLGEAPCMRELRRLVEALARAEPSDGSPLPAVLIEGETGTGKELVARACHLASPRSGGPFIEVNCAALPHTLLEDELFGHEKGAFTDARARKPGLIEAADGGTLFLDEIGELELPLQAKLLRVLENLKVRPIGALHDRRVNVRVVAATNRDLSRDAQAGRFRFDLLFRLSVLHLRVPPLRERGNDVLLLAREFLQRLATRYAHPALTLEEDAVQALFAYSWPGNVRELRNCLERAVLMQRGPKLGADDLGLPAAAVDRRLPLPPTMTAGPTSLDSMERQHLLDALEASGWNVSLAARALQITRDTLRYRMAKHRLQRDAEH